jgi:hypothetical protein
MKKATLLVGCGIAGLLAGCAGFGPTTGTFAFKHPVLRGVESTAKPFELSAFDLKPARVAFAQRCTTRFRHPALNRCNMWLPDESLSSKKAALACGAGRGACNRVLANKARDMLKRPRHRIGGRTNTQDCSGFVMASLASAGVDVRAALPARLKKHEGGVSLLLRMARERGRVYRKKVPAIGDLVFFDNTWDRNGNGRADDPLTHVGVVERVDGDGTVRFIHRVERGILRYRMNLFRPDVRRDPKTGKVLNHHLRLGGSKKGQRLTGQLFHAFATVLR